jgi:hypothetical protein
MYGKLIVTNTSEDFINKDKKKLINDFGKEVFNYLLISNKLKLNIK